MLKEIGRRNNARRRKRTAWSMMSNYQTAMPVDNNIKCDFLLSIFKVVAVIVQSPLAWVTFFSKYGNHDVSIGSSSPLITGVYVSDVVMT